MDRKPNDRRGRGAKGAPGATGQRPTALRARKVPDGSGWELIHPRCARERMDDIEEVQHMVAAGETEVALDELRWLLNGCGDFVDAHRLLGELALLENDPKLARGHFGYAFDIGMAAIHAAGSPAPFSYTRPANQAFLECGKGLAHCLKAIEKPALARDILQELLRLDPSDPLGAKEMLAELKG